MSVPSFEIRQDGSVNIDLGGIMLTGIVPYVEERPAFPFSVSVSDDSVTYRTERGNITLSFHVSHDELIISASADLKVRVHDIEPIGTALLNGADDVYYQGQGMEGPSGYHPIDSSLRNSFGIIGLRGEDKAAAAFAVDHTRFNIQFAAYRPESIYSQRAVFKCGIDLEETADGTVDLPEIHFITGSDVVSCMSRAAHEIARYMNARNVMPSAFHWCSWYYYYENMSQEILEGFLDGLYKRPVGFRYIQIDAGYTDHTGDWFDINDRYPEGLGKAAESIIKEGYEAGIWIAPFMVGDCSATYKAHPDWIIRNKDGSPFVIFRSYTEPKIWGNTDSDYYVLDTTNPEAFEYLKSVFETFRQYGFRLYKIDFLKWCFVDTSSVIRYDMSRTSVQVLRDVLSMIREVTGDDSYILASIAPYMPCIGFADGVRIAGDMGASWSGAYGPENLLKELPYVNYFNNVFWQNDPDAVILRDFGTHLSDMETKSLALLQALSGGMISTSDPVQDLDSDRRKLLDFITPSDARAHAEIPCVTEDPKTIVITHNLSDWNLLFVLNKGDEPVTVFYDLEKLLGTKALFQYRFNWKDSERIESEKISYFSDTILPHDSVLLFVTERPLNEKPSNLWGRENNLLSKRMKMKESEK